MKGKELDPYITEETIRESKETLRQSQLQKKFERELTPHCPDGSGRVGSYSPEASTWFGESTYVTEDKTYFFWVESLQRGKIINKERLPFHLR